MATNDSNLVFGVLDLTDRLIYNVIQFEMPWFIVSWIMCNNSANKSYLNEILSGFEEPF